MYSVCEGTRGLDNLLERGSFETAPTTAIGAHVVRSASELTIHRPMCCIHAAVILSLASVPAGISEERVLLRVALPSSKPA